MAGIIGYGTILEVADPATPTVFTAVALVKKLKPIGWKADSIDTTTMGSPSKFREKIAGLLDLTNPTLEILFNPGDATDVLLQSIIGVAKIFRITFTNGVTWAAAGFVTEYSPDTPLDAANVATITIETTSLPTVTASAAPVNSVLPAVSGSLVRGNILTAYEGVWSGAPTFTYVWKKGGVANGTTTKTYLTVVGDVAGIITCTVTATNTAGSASATSSNLGAIT
ncbi:MAG: phage tail tube protein [Aestuariivirga sp.]